ncbi:MAG: cation transporting ATPase C-terminal domain-containing protein, partial [Clostridiaceae bacterium]|nr:cation transporting ATPase C-terminal domain-containing protein [Clostridiaceae bacterium]
KFLIGAIVLGILLQGLIISIPVLATIFSIHALNLVDWGFVIILSLMPLVVNEIVKLFKRNSSNP